MIKHITQSANVRDFEQNALTRYRSGFITQNLNEQPDICYYGCSFTYGQGVNENERWTNIVDRECNLTSNNFGQNGIGIDEIALLFKITTQLFQIKKAVVLLPMWGRQTMPMGIDYRKSHSGSLNAYVNLGPGFLDWPDAETQEITRAWFGLPESYYIDRAMISIDLIQYVAQVNHIDLFWSSWVPKLYDFLPEPRLPLFIMDRQGSDGRHSGPEAHRCFARQVVQAL